MELNYILLTVYIIISFSVFQKILKRNYFWYQVIFYLVSIISFILFDSEVKELFILFSTVQIFLLYFVLRKYNAIKSTLSFLKHLKILIFIIGFVLCLLNQYLQFNLLFSFSLAVLIIVVLLKIFIDRVNLSTVIKDNYAIDSELLTNYSSVNNENIFEDDLKELQSILDKIIKLFEETNCYLDPDYSITRLEEDLVIPKVKLSKALNKVAQMNFYSFVAMYRINYSKEILKSKQMFTLESLSSESGFYSKSSFNKYFKKFVGTTPSNYKLEQ